MSCEFKEKIVSEAVGIFLLIGTFVSYLPQYFKVVKSRTSKGVSLFRLFLVNVHTFQNWLNALILQWKLIECCSEENSWHCNASLFSMYALFINWIMNFGLYPVCLLYFDTEGLPEKHRLKKIHWIFFVAFVLFSVISFGIPLWLALIHGFLSESVEIYAYIISISASIIVAIVWWPQIVETYRLKSPGSFSVSMLILQTPGAYLFTFFLAVLYHTNISTWIAPLISAVAQTLLLGMCIYYLIKMTKQERQEEAQLLLNTGGSNTKIAWWKKWL